MSSTAATLPAARFVWLGVLIGLLDAIGHVLLTLAALLAIAFETADFSPDPPPEPGTLSRPTAPATGLSQDEVENFVAGLERRSPMAEADRAALATALAKVTTHDLPLPQPNGRGWTEQDVEQRVIDASKLRGDDVAVFRFEGGGNISLASATELNAVGFRSAYADGGFALTRVADNGSVTRTEFPPPAASKPRATTVAAVFGFASAIPLALALVATAHGPLARRQWWAALRLLAGVATAIFASQVSDRVGLSVLYAFAVGAYPLLVFCLNDPAAIPGAA